MKAEQNSTRRLGVALACGTLTFALSAQAAKPPPKPPPSPAYVAVLMGGLRSSDGAINTYASDLNNAGQVVGNTAIPGFLSGTYSQAFLINPQDANGDGKLEWFADAVDNATGAPGPDGQNDLIIALGTLPTCVTCGRHGFATAVSDLGLVVGTSSGYDFASKVGSQQAFIVVPKDTDSDGRADCWYEDLNGDGFNDLMAPLGRPDGVPDTFVPTEININNVGQVTGWFYDPNVPSRVGFLLTPEDSDVDGKPDLWYREGAGEGVNALMVILDGFFPRSINDQGQIAGITQVRSAMLRNSDGFLIDLKPGGTVSEAIAINDRGQIGVWWQVDGVGHAGLLTPLDTDSDGMADTWCHDANGDGVNDLIVDLGNLKGMENSYVRPHSLNETGSVLGGSWHAGRDGLGWNRAAFLWENGALQSLKNLTGGTADFRDAYAINDARQIICELAGGRDNPGLHPCILLPTR